MSESRQTEEIYVDGLEGLILGYPISKVQFTSIAPDQEGPSASPKQVPRLVVAIPTGVLLQACNAILNSVKSQRENMLEAVNTQHAAFVKSLPAADAESEGTKKRE